MSQYKLQTIKDGTKLLKLTNPAVSSSSEMDISFL